MMTLVDLDLFYGMVKFCSLDFKMGNSEKVYMAVAVLLSDVEN